ncbi:MAG: GNAT family N-acetyltransferase, partial [Acidobacteria bacterium]
RSTAVGAAGPARRPRAAAPTSSGPGLVATTERPVSGRDWWIRIAGPEDAAVVSDVLLRAGIVAWGGYLGTERIERANRGRPQPANLVAVDARGVFAFVAWDPASGEITRLYTDPRAWGRGAGSALLALAVDALGDASRDQAWLYAEERNERALRFYRERGWREDGEPRVRDWHGARLRELRLALDIGPARERSGA